MLDKLIGRIPLSTKLRLGLNAIGVTSSQQTILDGFIASVGTNPVVSVALGKEVSSLAGLADTIADWSVNADSHTFGVPTARRILADTRGKEMVATIIIDAIARSKDKAQLEEIIGKIAQAPLPGFGDTTYPDVKSFLVEGALPLVASLLPDEGQSDGLGAIVKCPYCHQTHIYHI